MLDIHALAEEVRGVSPESEHDDVLDLLLRSKAAAAFLRDTKRALDERIIEWCQARKQDLVLVEKPGEASPGDTRWYVAPNRSVELRHEGVTGLATLLEDLLDATSGEVEKVAECLSSGAFKQGAVKTLHGEELWRTHFEVREPDALKEGKPTAVQRKAVVLVEEKAAFASPARRRSAAHA